MTTVPDWGRRDAPLVLIGEAPGRNEMERGQPFIGRSGERLEVWWRQYGMTRQDFYITNVMPYMPDDIDKVPQAEMECHIRDLHHRLEQLSNPQLIVPAGNYALFGLTGKGKVSWCSKDGRHERPGIMAWRGSILSTRVGRRDVKVIPILHPAYVLRMPSLERETLDDWRRISEDRHFPELRLPVREHIIKPTAAEAIDFLYEMHHAKVPVGLDIETPRTRITEVEVVLEDAVKKNTKLGIKSKRAVTEWQTGVKRGDPRTARYKSGVKKGQPKVRESKGIPVIGCTGVANNPHQSMTIPHGTVYWTPDEWRTVSHQLGLLLADPAVELILQNGMFDAGYFRWEGFDVQGYRWDTRAMHHLLDPRARHSLDAMASRYTRQPFWKHEAKDPDEVEKYASNSEALWTYCGMDVTVMHEIWGVLYATLHERDLLGFYDRHYTQCFPPLLDMLIHGIAKDETRRKERAAKLDAEADVLLARMNSVSSIELVPKTAVSGDRLKYLFYGAKGFPTTEAGQKKVANLIAKFPDCTPFNIPPRHKKRGKGPSTVTVDEVTVRRLMMRYPQLKPVGEPILQHRRNRKVREFLDEGLADTDGRIRCQYGLYTDAGRLASSATPWRTGRNLQNQDREIRDVFVPDQV